MTITVVPFSQYEPIDENELCSLVLEGESGRFNSDTAESDTFLFPVADVSNFAQEIMAFLENPRTRQTAFEPIEAKFIVSLLRQKRGIRVSVNNQLIEIGSDAGLCRALLRCLMAVEESLVRKIAVTDRNREAVEEFTGLLEKVGEMDTHFNAAPS